MDIFIGHTLLEGLRKYWHKECASCTKDDDIEIIMCNVHHNILIDCYKWKMKIISEENFGTRLKEEKRIIEQIDKDKFKDFWRNNRDKFTVYNAFVLEDHDKYKTKEDVLKLYNFLLKEHNKETK